MRIDKTVDELKYLLRKEIGQFCSGNHVNWKKPILSTIVELKNMNWPAVFFGGTLRSLLLSRLRSYKPGRPRDIDIVIQGIPIETIHDQFQDLISRNTRFGGLQLKNMGWQFDVWPLENTWAISHDNVDNPKFDYLPQTTFFNVEAIAVEVWPKPGLPRAIFSGNDQFFKGIINNVVEINREENPFPELCIVRGLLFASSLNFHLGIRLMRFIAKHGVQLTSKQLEDIQIKHYGKIRKSGKDLLHRIKHITETVLANGSAEIQYPPTTQLGLWCNDNGEFVDSLTK